MTPGGGGGASVQGSGPSLADRALDALDAPRGRDRRAFSSNLSVDETVALSGVGYEAAGLVMGVSICHLGYGFAGLTESVELTELSAGFEGARERALGRLREHCRRAGGDGVVGVRLALEALEGGRALEFAATGTAVRAVGRSRPPADPFTSALSGEEFALLVRAGWEPLALVMGACVYHVALQGLRQWTSGANAEIGTLTEALYAARELAMERLQAAARREGEAGVVGMRVEQRHHAFGYRAVEFLAVGTAVRLAGADHRTLGASLVVPLDDPVPATDPSALLGRGAD
jgi:uncharacterized protein YbjQ (UPF0145 family)